MGIWMKSLSATIHMKATEQLVILSCHDNVYYAVQGGSYFFETVKNSCSVPIQIKTSLPILSAMVLLIMLYKVARTFESFNKIQ